MDGCCIEEQSTVVTKQDKILGVGAVPTQPPAPKDKFYFIYIVFILNGGAVWLGWDLINFLGPTYYFDYWFSNVFHIPTHYATDFLTFALGELACSPLFVMAFVAIIPMFWIPMYLRFLVSILVSISTISALLYAACTKSPTFQGMGSFYNYSVILICVYMGAVGAFQSYLFGMAADFPAHYTTAVVIGTNVGGIIASLAYVFSTTANPPTPNPVAVGYYAFIIAYLVVCAASVAILWRSSFFQHYQRQAFLCRRDACFEPKKFFKNMGEVFCKAWKELLNILMIFFTMYGIFPAMSVGIQPWPTPGMPKLPKYYLPIGTFLNFYVFATIGAIASLFVRINPKNIFRRTLLMIPSYLGMYSILYFMFCNFQPNYPKKRKASVVFKNEWFYFVGNALLGLFMGLMSGILMTLMPKVVRPELSRLAALMATATLVTGLYMGAGMSNGFQNIVSN